MKQFRNIYILCSTFLIFAACSNYLNQVPDEELKESDLFSSKDNVVAVLTQVYSYQPQTIDFMNYAGICGDDVDFNWNNYDPYYMDIGEFSASSPIFNRWSDYFTAIRTAIYFIDRLPECKDEKLTDQERTWWAGEAYFLEAYYNFLLLQQYGPIPIIDDVYDGDALVSAMNDGIPRAPFDSCVVHIDRLLVEAENRLEPSYWQSIPDRAGRANATAARFLRARLWLYAASPLYNGMKTDTKNLASLNPTDNDGNKLINEQFDANKWKNAMDYALDAINFGLNAGFHLMQQGLTGNPNTNNNYWYYKYNFCYARGGDASPEMVFYKQDFSTGTWLQHCLPISWSLYSGICPTMEHVNEYFMANGLEPEDDPAYASATGIDTYNAGNFSNIQLNEKFRHREPRFYSNILFPDQYSYIMADSVTELFNSKWSNYSTGVSGSEDVSYFRPYYNGNDGYAKKTGRDFCETGFLAIKWVMPTASPSNKGDNASPIFRFSELYLNYTEAAFEYYVSQGENPLNHPEIFTYWDQIRDRSGIPSVLKAYPASALTVSKLRELIHRERRVELAFEGHRRWDNRRWLDAEREGGDKHGFDIMKNYDTGFWNTVTFETRVWYPDNRMYFMPIPQTEINKNPKMTQNVGW